MNSTAKRRRALSLLGIAGLLAAPALAGCGGQDEALATAEQEQSTRTDVPFNGCDTVKCTGQMTGAAYEIQLPKKWNGTLLIYNHGYRPAEPAPPDFAPVDHSAVPAGGAEVAAKLLDEGYALAASAFKTNGWDVLDATTTPARRRSSAPCRSCPTQPR